MPAITYGKTDKNAAQQTYHFYATTAFCWHTALTREEAIRQALIHTRSARGKAEDKKTGEYVWSCRVELPQTANYTISHYTPDAEITASEEAWYRLTDRNTTLVLVKEGR